MTNFSLPAGCRQSKNICKLSQYYGMYIHSRYSAECESELIGGYHTEYSSMKLGFYLFAEYINMFISATMISTLYFGSYNFPGMHWVGDHLGNNWLAIIEVAVLFSKIIFFIFFFMWVRWTLPRFRYDQLMHLGWKVLIPLAIINMLITGGWMTYVWK